MSSVETDTRVDGSVGLPALVLSWGSALLLAGSYSALYSLDQLLSYGDILGPHAAILQFAVMAILIGVHEGIHAISTARSDASTTSSLRVNDRMTVRRRLFEIAVNASSSSIGTER